MFGMTDKQLLTLTDSAAERVKSLMKLNDKAIGLRVGVKMAGCSGFSYTMDYAEEASGTEDVIEDKGVKLLIEPTAAMFLLGTELDWHEDKLESRFVFNNPNVKGMCGCGESFTV
jgi:iron-sulfur cluster assembly accessory protein